jgi:putative membrane protein
MSPEELKSSNELAGERTDLALDRTIMAADRTLMAWIRTGLSTLSFGFTIYKFLQAAVEKKAGDVFAAHGPERLGLFLIGMGTASMVVGLIEYYQTYKKIGKASGFSLWNLTFVFAGIGVTLGSFLFFTILFHAEVF